MGIPLGAKVRDERRKRGWSQAELAGRLGHSSRSYIAQLEGGKYKQQITVQMLKRIADVFEMSTAELLEGTEYAPECPPQHTSPGKAACCGSVATCSQGGWLYSYY